MNYTIVSSSQIAANPTHRLDAGYWIKKHPPETASWISSNELATMCSRKDLRTIMNEPYVAMQVNSVPYFDDGRYAQVMSSKFDVGELVIVYKQKSEFLIGLAMPYAFLIRRYGIHPESKWLWKAYFIEQPPNEHQDPTALNEYKDIISMRGFCVMPQFDSAINKVHDYISILEQVKPSLVIDDKVVREARRKTINAKFCAVRIWQAGVHNYDIFTQINKKEYYQE